MAIGRRGILLGSTALVVGAPAILRAQPATGQKVNVSHGFAMHGAPKYPVAPPHLDYVNPAAPKGGNVKFAALGTFDSLHPFTLKGVPAANIGQLWETLCWHARDEAFTVYGLLRTADSVSPLQAPAVGASLLGFIVVYFIVFGAGVLYLFKLFSHAPHEAEHGPEDAEPIRTAGITPGPPQLHHRGDADPRPAQQRH